MRSRTFLNVALGILALAAAYHLGARSATAQSGSMVSGVMCNASGFYTAVLTQSGDMYVQLRDSQTGPFLQPPTYVGNFWGGATPTTQESFGSLKARYRGEREPQDVKPSSNR